MLIGMVHTKSSAEYTPLCIQSLLENTKFSDRDSVLVIDNDNSLNTSLNHPRLSIHKNEIPRSFSQNANYIATIAMQKGVDCIFSNNDIIFTHGWLEPLRNDIFAIQIPSCNMQWQYEREGLKLQMSVPLHDYLGKESVFKGIAQHHMSRSLGLRLMHSIPYYCVKLSRAVISTIGFFDERYSPFGWEDTDYSVRAYQAGVPIYLNQDSYILHFYGKSTWNIDNEPPKDDSASAQAFIKKWGLTIAQAFALQEPSALATMKAIEDKHVTKAYQEFIERFKGK